MTKQTLYYPRVLSSVTRVIQLHSPYYIRFIVKMQYGYVGFIYLLHVTVFLFIVVSLDINTVIDTEEKCKFIAGIVKRGSSHCIIYRIP